MREIRVNAIRSRIDRTPTLHSLVQSTLLEQIGDDSDLETTLAERRVPLLGERLELVG